MCCGVHWVDADCAKVSLAEARDNAARTDQVASTSVQADSQDSTRHTAFVQSIQVIPPSRRKRQRTLSQDTRRLLAIYLSFYYHLKLHCQQDIQDMAPLPALYS